jgi:hypothetical protein
MNPPRIPMSPFSQGANTVRFLSRLFNCRRALPTRRPALTLLALEDRTTPSVGPPVPVSVTVLPAGSTPNNESTFLSFDAAINRLGYYGGTITVEPGALAPTGPLTINTLGVTIQGDPNVPGSILPPLNLTFHNNQVVSLLNLNLSSVTFDSNIITIARSTVGNINLTGGTKRVISQNYITGEVILGTPQATATSDQVVNNTFAGFSPTMLQLQQDNNAVIKGNSFFGAGVPTMSTITPGIGIGPQTAISIQSSQNVTVVNNVIRLPGDHVVNGATGVFTAIAIGPTTTSTGNPLVVTYGPVSTGSILNNVLSAGNTGTGLSITSQSNETTTADADTRFLVQGNDFNNDAVGVNYIGSGGATIGTDLGGGGALKSLGGNNLRSYTSAATSGAGAIVASNLGNGAVFSAHANIFGIGVNPSNVVFVTQSSGGTATIDVGSPLTNDQAFVQTLYNNFLGRSASITELNSWVNVLTGTGPNTGQAAVAQGIAGSAPALTLLIDGYYLKYLGRQADTGGEQYWVSQIQAGMPLESVQAGFAASLEFISANNADYVQALYRTFLGRTGSSADLAYWYGQLQQPNGLNLVAQGFANSQENKNLFINRFFTNFLHKPASSNDLAYWSTQGSFFSIAIGILSSPDYYKFG